MINATNVIRLTLCVTFQQVATVDVHRIRYYHNKEAERADGKYHRKSEVSVEQTQNTRHAVRQDSYLFTKLHAIHD